MMQITNFPKISNHPRLCSIAVAIGAFLALAWSSAAAASSAYVRVNQVGYESANPPFQAYLMSTASESGATFDVINSEGQIRYSSAIGALLGTWSLAQTFERSGPFLILQECFPGLGLQL